MPDIDITLLQLSPPSSEGSLEMLRLSKLCIDSGLHAKVSTNPVELAKMRAPGRTAIVVIDGLRNGDYDAYALVSILRCVHRVGIIMLVANDSATRSRALSAGADLCVSYPVDVDEFHSAVCAVARRCTPEPCACNDNGMENFAPPHDVGLSEYPPETNVIGAGPTDEPAASATWILTARGWSLRSPEGTTITLTATERMLMSSLFAAQRSVVSHEDLLTQHGYTIGNSKSPLTVTISRLKKKCSAGGVRLPILSCRSKGYRFDASCAIES